MSIMRRRRCPARDYGEKEINEWGHIHFYIFSFLIASNRPTTPAVIYFATVPTKTVYRQNAKERPAYGFICCPLYYTSPFLWQRPPLPLSGARQRKLPRKFFR